MTFRVLLRGVFRPRQKAIKRNGITVQLPKPPNDDDLKKEWDEALRERYQKLFERYFYNMSFDVYWGDQKEFLRTLRDFICEDPRAP
jgi:hypothetical protein